MKEKRIGVFTVTQKNKYGYTFLEIGFSLVLSFATDVVKGSGK